MLRHIEEFDKYVLITGFKNVEIVDIEKFLKRAQKGKPADVDVQFFDAERIASWQHLYFAVLNALNAFANNENISKNLALETMIYASAQRQIRKAMRLLGVNPKTSQIAMLIIGDNPAVIESTLSIIAENIKGQHDDIVLELSPQKMQEIQKIFGISSSELETTAKRNDLNAALIDAVIERMALVATKL